MSAAPTSPTPRDVAAHALSEGRRLLRAHQVSAAFGVLYPVARHDRDVAELTMQLAFPLRRIRQLSGSDVGRLRCDVQTDAAGRVGHFLFGAYLLANRRHEDDVREAMQHLQKTYTNYLADDELGDGIFLLSQIHRHGLDGVIDDYAAADLLSLADAADSQMAALFALECRTYGLYGDEADPAGVVEKVRQVLHIVADADIDASEAAQGSLQHPALWAELALAYRALGQTDLAERACRRARSEGMTDFDGLHLLADDGYALGNIEPVRSTRQHLDRPWHSLKTYHRPRPADERVAGADGMTETERRDAFLLAMRDFPTPSQRAVRAQHERQAQAAAAAGPSRPAAEPERPTATDDRPLVTVVVSGGVDAVDPGCRHHAPWGSRHAVADLTVGQDLLTALPTECAPYVDAVRVERIEATRLTVRYGSQSIIIDRQTPFSSGEIGLSYAYAYFRISVE